MEFFYTKNKEGKKDLQCLSLSYIYLYAVSLTSTTFDSFYKTPTRLKTRRKTESPERLRERERQVLWCPENLPQRPCAFTYVTFLAQYLMKNSLQDLSSVMQTSKLYLCFQIHRAAEATVHRSGPSLQTQGPRPSGRWAGVETGSLTARALWVVERSGSRAGTAAFTETRTEYHSQDTLLPLFSAVTVNSQSRAFYMFSC